MYPYQSGTMMSGYGFDVDIVDPETDGRINVEKVSYVLTAMGLDADRISSAIRISWGAHTDKDELINELSELIAVAKSLVF